MTEVVVNALDALADRAAAELARAHAAAVEANRSCVVVLSGGSVGDRFFSRLAAQRLDWSRCEFFWADERAVPPDAPDSNYLLARQRWFEPAHVPPDRVHRMQAERPDADRAADEYANALARAAGLPPVPDFVLLGVGPDGHIASLFPGHPQLDDTERIALIERQSPKPPSTRMTLSLPVLAGARTTIVAAFGAEKAGVIDEALEDPRSALPVARLLRAARRAIVLVDTDLAAARAQFTRPS
jgi:6-phosphogluconolactonase